MLGSFKQGCDTKTWMLGNHSPSCGSLRQCRHQLDRLPTDGNVQKSGAPIWTPNCRAPVKRILPKRNPPPFTETARFWVSEKLLEALLGTRLGHDPGHRNQRLDSQKLVRRSNSQSHGASGNWRSKRPHKQKGSYKPGCLASAVSWALEPDCRIPMFM